MTSNRKQSTRTLDCDVLVIGAGPAGSSAARAVAESGGNVIMIDRRHRIGMPQQCAGFLPAAVALSPEMRGSVCNRIQGMLTFLPDGSVEETDSPGYIIQRDRFDRGLATAAAAAGAFLYAGARAVQHVHNLTRVHTDSGYIEIRSTITIGADGPRSIAGSWMGSSNSNFVLGAQWTVKLNSRLRKTRIYFDRHFPGGYGWLFPGVGFARVGIGLDRSFGVNASEALKYFVDRLAVEGLINAEPQSITGGLIPVGGTVTVFRDDIILAGDAAGLCHPISGAGIAMALDSGRLAGLAAAAALRAGKSALNRYVKQIDTLYGRSLSGAVRRRQEMYAGERDGAADFNAAIRRVWIGLIPASVRI